MRIRVYAGDIVRQAVDAIVNAANSGLKLGGGIDNAIRTAAGPDIEQALAQHSWVSEGTAILTPGFRLPAKWVIHTVAPRWQAGAKRAPVGRTKPAAKPIRLAKRERERRVVAA